MSGDWLTGHGDDALNCKKYVVTVVSLCFFFYFKYIFSQLRLTYNTTHGLCHPRGPGPVACA